MKRHPALVPIAHDHHHALVAARRLRRAADAPEAAAAAAAFLRFFAEETTPHFREEEELLFPSVIEFEETRELLVLEERRLFPLIERLLEDATAPLLSRREEVEAARGQRPDGADALASDELNVTPLSWKAGSGPPEHVNEERDVLVFVLDGAAILSIDGEERKLARGESAMVAKGRRRKITAGLEGVCYLSIHQRRPPLQIGRAAPGGATGPAPSES